MASGSTVLFPKGGAGISSSHRISNCFVHIVLAMLVIGFPSAHSQIEKMYVDVTDLKILVDETYLLKLVQIGQYNTTLEVTAQIQHTDIVQFVPATVEIPGTPEPNTTVEITHDICAYGKSPGHSEVTFNVTPSGFVNSLLFNGRRVTMNQEVLESCLSTSCLGHILSAFGVSIYFYIVVTGTKEPNITVEITHDFCAYGNGPGHSEATFIATPSGFVNLDTVFLRITVMHSHIISVISYIMGWIYFAAWSVSFYPQIYINFKRKSVVGLNFDFLALNVMGFTMYSLFNCGLYFSKEIQGQYFSRHPRGLNPVQLNDVFFSLHAAFATLITITQCFIYERDDQRVSNAGRGILGLFSGIVLVTACLGAASVVEWLDFLYYCSYIKLAITLIKYVPQAYMNYQRKSTVGWSIGNIFLDFVGGFLSILQMTLNAYNYNDWVSFFGDATKFGLGLFSLIFDIFFILQHYVFYREGKEFVIVQDNSDDISDNSKNDNSVEYVMITSMWHADEKKYDLEGKV